MPYNLHFSNTGTVFVPDMPPGINEIDTSLSLVGRGYPNYGEKIAENFLHLLENFASPVPPVNPIPGQLWYDTANSNNKVLRIMSGSRDNVQWPNVTGIYQQDLDPQLENQSFKEGDIWVDTTNYQLNIYAGGEWAIVGPSESPNTGAFSATLADNTNTDITYDAILNTVNNEVVSAIVDDEFTVFLENTHKYDLGNLPVPLKKGINLSRGSILNGTSASALGLKLSADGDLYPASNFLRKNNNSPGGELITGKVSFVGSYGVTISSNAGDNTPIRFYKNGNDAVVLNDTPGGKIIFKVKGSTGGDLATAMYMEKSLVKINVTTEAVNSTTGALVVAGGVAIGGNLYLGKRLYVNSITLTTGTLTLANTAISTSTTTGALIVAGGVGIGGRLNIGNTATIYSTAESISTTTGAAIVVGGVGIGGNLNVGRRIALDNNFYLTQVNTNPVLAFNPNSYISFDRVGTQLNFVIDAVGSMALAKNYVLVSGTATSISTTTGALIVAGGVGIGGNLNVGRAARILSTANSISTTTGALQVSGGVGIGGNLNVGSTSSVFANSYIGENTSTTYIGGYDKWLVLDGIPKETTAGIAGIELRGGSVSGNGIQSRINFVARTTNGTDVNSGRIEFTNSANKTNTGIMKIYTAGFTSGLVEALRIDDSQIVSVQSNEISNSTNTGALQVAGGVGIGGNLYIGGSLYVNGVLTSGSGTSLPAQTGNSGKYLTTNGSGTLSWGTPAGGGGGTRTSVQTTTASLANGASATATVTAAKGYALYSIQVSAGAWVTVYCSAAAQSADSGRTISTDPSSGSGVIAEAISTLATTTYFTPAVIGFNVDPSTSSNAYLKIANNSGGTSAITVTLTYLPLEN
jgi:hypothetical protein